MFNWILHKTDNAIASHVHNCSEGGGNIYILMLGDPENILFELKIVKKK